MRNLYSLTRGQQAIPALTRAMSDLRPGTDVLAAFKAILNKDEFERRAQELTVKFQSRTFHPVTRLLTSTQRNEQLGINHFAQELFPIITRYFGQEADETPDEIIDRGYVTTDERAEYGSVLETYLKDRARTVASGLLQPISTGRSDNALDLTTEVRKYGRGQRMKDRGHRIEGRVQLIVGAVGSGKSLFIRRFYRRLLPPDLAQKTMWAIINFNNEIRSPTEIREAILRDFIQSFCESNNVNIESLEDLEKLFSHELAAFERGPAKILKNTNQQQYHQQRYLKLKELSDDKEKIVSAIARHYTGERRIGLVVVFDNVDKRSRDVQLAIFEGAQWFKELTRALVIITLRDTTFEAHREEKPLDAFINAVNFYIRPPRFALMLRKRLEIVIENVAAGEYLAKLLTFTLESGLPEA
jgi:Cdc6-like AAA superfamily ATPase